MPTLYGFWRQARSAPTVDKVLLSNSSTTLEGLLSNLMPSLLSKADPCSQAPQQ
jgi:hypothetical protein